MANVSNNTATAYTSQRIAANLGLTDITPQSKITLLTQGLLNEKEIFNAYNETSTRNMYVQTADEDYLEFVGVAEGIVRTKEPMLRLTAEDAAVSIKLDIGDTVDAVLTKNTSLELVEGQYWVRLNKDVDLNLATEDFFLDCDILTNEDVNTVSFSEGSSYEINIQESVYRVTFNRDVNIPTIIEDLETYRSRVLFGKQATTTGSESAVRLAVSSISLITSYTNNYTSLPYQIQIFNKSLLESDLDYDNLSQYAVPILQTKLDTIKSEGSMFEVTLPKKVNFSLALRPNKTSPKEVPSTAYFLRDYLKLRYSLGREIRVTKDLFVDFLTRNGEDTTFLEDYDLVIYKNFLGNAYESELNYIDIATDEYPFLNEVIVE